MAAPDVKSRLIVAAWIPILAAMAYLLIGKSPCLICGSRGQREVADDLLTAKIDKPPSWAFEDGRQLISAMQTNVHRNADDPNRWMRLSELFLSMEATDSARKPYLVPIV